MNAVDVSLFGDSENLKCSSCTNYLSYFPLYLHQKTKNICGRCATQKIISDSSTIKHDTLESVLQHMEFPCQYHDVGCLEKKLPKDIPLHEESCFHRIVDCPTATFTKCFWDGSKPFLLDHCHEAHSDLFLENGEFELNLASQDSSAPKYNLMEFGKVLYIVLQKFDTTAALFKISVFHIEIDSNLPQISYEVCVSNTLQKISINSSSTTFEEQTFFDIFLNSLKDDEVKSQTLQVKITLDQSGCLNSKEQLSKLNASFLSELKCKTCEYFAIPPIYENVEKSGENVLTCGICCQDGKAGTRNFSLDNMANLLIYPCKFEKNGCDYIAKPNEMKEHINYCLKKDTLCPVRDFTKCAWHGLLSDLNNHVENAHSKMMTSQDEKITEKFQTYSSQDAYGKTVIRSIASDKTNDDYNVKCYIVKFANNFFRVDYIGDSINFSWAVQKIGPTLSPETFLYDLEVFGQTDTPHKLTIRGLCSSFYETVPLFKASNRTSYNGFINNIPREKLYKCEKFEEITFRITILNKKEHPY